MIKKCVLPVAGYGTRFLPVTKVLPKEMLPILDKPLVQYGIEEAEKAGLTQICFVTGQSKRAIEDHFDRNVDLDVHLQGTERATALNTLNDLIEKCQFTYTRQVNQLGLGHAIKVSQSLVGNEPFGVILPDDFCVSSDLGVMEQLMRVYSQYQCSVIAVEDVQPEQTASYGIIKGEEIEKNLVRVDDLVEKPQPSQAPSNTAVIGRYILTPEIFDELEHISRGISGEYQLTDALARVARSTQVLALKFRGKRFDCGSLEGFVEATNYCYNARLSRSLS